MILKSLPKKMAPIGRRLSPIVIASLIVLLGRGGRAEAETPASASVNVVVDRTAVRFYAPETGGAAHPIFLTARSLAFEARLEALREQHNDGFEERHLRSALDHRIAQEMLSRLPLEPEPDAATVSRVGRTVRSTMLLQVGGEEELERIAKTEGIEVSEIDRLIRLRSRAALYVELSISPVLYPTEEQLREAYRTTAHPFRALQFDQTRTNLELWLVGERLRVAESTFLQGARMRIKVTPIYESST